jgi:hypothetical protein
MVAMPRKVVKLTAPPAGRSFGGKKQTTGLWAGARRVRAVEALYSPPVSFSHWWAVYKAKIR